MWITYIIQLSDDSYYTGATNDFEKRMKMHANKKGSKYVASRLPIKDLVYVKLFENKGDALRHEYNIKSLTRRQKKKLISEQSIKADLVKWVHDCNMNFVRSNNVKL